MNGRVDYGRDYRLKSTVRCLVLMEVCGADDRQP